VDIKMIVTDLDGTLLRTNKSISEQTKLVLEQCRKRGVKVVYATGRGGSVGGVAPAELFDGRITMNGAVAIIDETVVYNRLIPYQTARPLLMACDKHGLKTTSERSGMHYANFIVSDEWPTITNFQMVDFSQHDMDAEKLYAIIRNHEDAELIKRHLPASLYLTISRDGLAQVMHKDATKSRAVSVLARLWDIAPEGIVAFGDDMNDIDMLNFAGTAVIMDNALDEVKAVADHICDTNDNDGVAKWLEENVLNKAS
jgi:Cof subfamily protein (haloacid dehalogenase superfamily)